MAEQQFFSAVTGVLGCYSSVFAGSFGPNHAAPGLVCISADVRPAHFIPFLKLMQQLVLTRSFFHVRFGRQQHFFGECVFTAVHLRLMNGSAAKGSRSNLKLSQLPVCASSRPPLPASPVPRS